MWKGFQFLFLAVVAIAGCSPGNSEHGPSVEANISAPYGGAPQPSPTSPSIRSVDFGNFTYSAEPVCPEGPKSFTLTNGKVRQGGVCDGVVLVYLDYGDATGDGMDEAIAVLTSVTKGSAIPYYVYVFTLDHQQPKLLWAFATGDRADGGLRQVRARGGELTIDLYGKEKVIGGKLYADDGSTGGACCPTHFTRTTYKWQRNAFTQQGTEEALPNPSGGAPVVMPKYEVRG